MKDDRLYLIHIKECIERIENYTDSKPSFFKDQKSQDAILRNLQVLAESTKRISEELKKKHPRVAWRAIAGFRNVAVHDYLGIDLKQVWDIIKTDLPPLKKEVTSLLKEIYPK